MVRAHDARPMMLVFEKPELTYSRAAAELAAEMSVPTVQYSGPRFDIVHPTKRGYAGLAEEILDRLAAEDYL